MSIRSEIPILTICIVSYNTESFTLETIRSVIKDLRFSPDLIENHQLIVVDNNSTDNSVPAIKRLVADYPEINLKVIANNKNLGFAAANNQAIKTSRSQFVLLLNSDTLVQRGALARLVFSMQNLTPNDATSGVSSDTNVDRLGIIAATLLNWDGTYQPQGGDLPNLLTLATQQLFIDDIPLIGKFIPSIQKTGLSTKSINLNNYDANQQLAPMGWVGGTAMLLRREMIDEIGDLDENIFMYAEDMEYCLRAKNHKWDVAIHPTARITHFQNASSSSNNAIIGEIKGILYLWSKHRPAWQYQLARFLLILGSRLRAYLYKVTANQALGQAYSDTLNYLKIKKHA